MERLSDSNKRDDVQINFIVLLYINIMIYRLRSKG